MMQPVSMQDQRTKGIGEVPKKAHYDGRIDFFRGLALVFIFINHIPDNIYSFITSRTYALFDSAEVFMFLAGYSAALAYYSLQSKGLQAYAAKALRRSRSILTYHALLVFFVLASAYLIGEATGIATGYELFLEKAGEDPLQVLVGIPLLAFQAPLLDILPMYVIVMLLAPFLIWLRTRGEFALLAASGLVWMFASRFFPELPTVTYDVTWNFNPFCWQFLFAIGLTFGWRTRSSAPPVATGDGRFVLDTCCIVFVVFSATVLMTIAFETLNDAAANRLRAMYFSLNKQTLDLWRVVGLLATAYLVARLVPRDAPWLKLAPSRLVCIAGASSLPIFSLTVVLSFLGKFAVLGLGGTTFAYTVVTGAGVATIFATAVALKRGIFKAAADSAIAGLHPARLAAMFTVSARTAVLKKKDTAA
jgi:hypothetical protein